MTTGDSRAGPYFVHDKPFYGYILTRHLDDIRRYGSMGAFGYDSFIAAVDVLSDFLTNKHDAEYFKELGQLRMKIKEAIQKSPALMNSAEMDFARGHYRSLIKLLARSNLLPSEGVVMDIPPAEDQVQVESVSVDPE